MSQEKLDGCFGEWTEREAVAEAMIPIIGSLNRKNDVIASVYGRPIINRSVVTILKAHRFVRQVEQEELSVNATAPILKLLDSYNLGPARIDIGKLAVKYARKGAGRSLDEFLRAELADVIDKYDEKAAALRVSHAQDVVLFGFGRIGRLLARIMLEKAGGGFNLRLRAIVVRKGKAANDLEKRASLLRRDSVHGPFQGTIIVDEAHNAIIANGNYIQVIYADAPDNIDYRAFGIRNAIVIDNTGVWRDRDGLERHLKSKGASRVLLTAPGKGDIKNIVFGINNHEIRDSDLILSAASCTTNAITPVLKAINDRFGIRDGHLETVHAFTNDQNLIDNYHKGSRRGRSALLNMVITETGAAKAVARALPALAGKLTGNAIRVPIPNVSLAILNLTLGKAVSVGEINDYMRDISLHSDLQKQIDFTSSSEVVSSDLSVPVMPAL
jgi:glyceraldehyde 3-phosphate dehydrogenase